MLDSGIDATHPAFARRSGDEPLAETADGLRAAGDSRIKATYDFTKLRALLAKEGTTEAEAMRAKSLNEINQRLLSGRAVDWSLLLPLIEVPKDPYEPPAHEHGTHVAGVLAGDWRQADPQGPADHDVQGVCPDMELYDLRVFDADGAGDEFAILAALQYVRWLNANASAPVIHGVNLSLSLDHEVGAYACGRTPVCDECERLIGSGTVVVAAAGNEGRAYYSMASGTAEGYRQISITDPGNADGVITVGATHRHQPHTYGVSYFSSRGPTGDGRVKPDLVAPGEKITAPVPNLGLKSLDGTSMAAPHVSGAAALLMARHPELIGSPREVKRVLCGPPPISAASATSRAPGWSTRCGRSRRCEPMVFSLEALQAFQGDSLLLYAGDKLCLIDGGPGQTWATSLRPRLEELRAGGLRAAGRCRSTSRWSATSTTTTSTASPTSAAR